MPTFETWFGRVECLSNFARKQGVTAADFLVTHPWSPGIIRFVRASA